MGYVSDWDQWARADAAAHAANPDCTERADCPASFEGHLLNCSRWRRALWVGRAMTGLWSR